MIIEIKVHPNSKREELKKINENSYEIWIKEKPEDNKANLSIIKTLKKYFKKEVKIKTGFNSRRKLIEIK